MFVIDRRRTDISETRKRHLLQLDHLLMIIGKQDSDRGYDLRLSVHLTARPCA